MDITEVQTDGNLWPLQSAQDKQIGLSIDPVITIVPGTSDKQTVEARITSSGKKIIVRKAYRKLLDALSYVGGILAAFVPAFFFMEAYGTAVFEMLFAAKYFKAKIAKDFGFLKWMQMSAYDVLKKVNKQPESWKDAETRNNLRGTVNDVLDITYMQRRIDLLEKAIEVVLKPHQIKGLLLSQNITKT